jgi:hypothetical protein
MVVAVVLGALAFGGSAGAQSAQSWSITPAGGSPDQPGNRPDLSFTVDPGTTITDTVQVWNYGADPIELKVYAADALITAEGSYDLDPADKSPVDVASWTRLSSNRVSLAPNSVIALSVVISVPKDALPGDHPGGIVASVVAPATDGQGAQILVETRVGTRLNVRVAGDFAPSAAIENMSASYSGSLNPAASGSVDVKFTVANTGNTRLGGTVRLEVSGMFGSKVVDLPDVPVTLPGNMLEQETTVDGIWPTGPITAKVIFTPFDDAGLVGVAESATASASASTFAWPLGQLFVLLISGVAVYLLMRRRKSGMTTPGIIDRQES